MDCSSACTLVTNTLVPELDWRFANGSWIVTVAESGSNRSRGEDRPSASQSQSEGASAKGPTILIVEDNRADVFLIRDALAATQLNPDIHVVNDGEEATRFFDRLDQDRSSPCPALIILDINLPKKQGGDVLMHMRNSLRCPNALILVVTTSDSPHDRQQMKQLGANGYFRKPSEYSAFLRLGDLVKELLSPEEGLART